MCFLFAFPISFSGYRVLFCRIPSMSNIKLPPPSRSAPQNKSCPQPGSPGPHFLSAPSSLAPCNLALTLSRELVPNQLINGKLCLTTSSPAYPAGPLLFLHFCSYISCCPGGSKPLGFLLSPAATFRPKLKDRFPLNSTKNHQSIPPPFPLGPLRKPPQQPWLDPSLGYIPAYTPCKPQPQAQPCSCQPSP